MPKPLGLICLLGVAQEAVWITTYAIVPLRENSGQFVGLMFAAFILCLSGYFLIEAVDRRVATLIVVSGLAFRLTVLPAAPGQSEDVYRYLWDARVASAGIDPYGYPPDAPELDGVRDETIYPMLNSKRSITAYPPLSQLLFRSCHAFFHDSVTAMKAMFSLFEFGALLVTWALLSFLGLDLRGLVLVAWNPFFIFEFSHSGHSDSAMMFFVLISVYLLCRARGAWAMVSYAAAVLSKLHPALWFPLYGRKANLKALAAGAAAGAILVLPYFSFHSGLKYLQSLASYLHLFEFNASIHYLLRFAGRRLFHQQWDQATGPYLAAILVAVVILIAWKFPLRGGRDLLHAGFWIMTADLCLATTVHPWYICWAALALPFVPYGFMTYWTGACFLSYLAYAYRPVYEPTWVLLAEYLPMYGLMGLEILRKRPLLEWRISRTTASCATPKWCSSCEG